MNRFLKNKTSIGFGLLALLLLLPQPVHGQLFKIGGDTVAFVIKILGAIAGFIIGILLSFAGGLVDIAFGLNMDFLNDKNDLITIGWGIMRDIANLGFVLVIIVIAFTTIIRFKEYEAKKLLPKLIAAAIIVNFSFVIAITIINFSNVFTNFFLKERIGAETSSISTVITGAFQPQRLNLEGVAGAGESPLPPDPSSTKAGGSIFFSEAAITDITKTVFTVIFTGLTAFVFFALAFMLIARFIILSLLIILAPITWLFWILPGLSKHFNDWWSSFFKWVFFAPAISFFIFLTLTSAEALADRSSIPNIQPELGGILGQGSQMLVIAALLMGGLIAANKMGVAGAGAAISMAQGAGKTTQKWAARQAGRAGAGVGQALGRRALTAGTRPDKETGEITSLVERAAGGLARIPYAGKVFRGTAERIGKAKAGLTDAVEERQKRLGGLTNADFDSRVRSTKRMTNPITAAAYAAESVKRGRTDKLGDKSLDMLLKGVKVTRTGKNILPSRPDFAPQLGTTIGEAMQSFKAGKAEDIDKDALKNIKVVTNLSPSHLKRISSHGSQEQKQAILNTLKGDASKLTAEEQLKLNNVANFTATNPNWQA